MEKDKMTKELLKFKTDTKDVLYQELITYKIINGMLTKEIVTRKFQKELTTNYESSEWYLGKHNNEIGTLRQKPKEKDDDYIDSWSYNPLCEAKED